jgi:sulfur transfer complex TusBCD TusB component (DsrH family)
MADIVTGTVTGQLDISDLLRATGDIRREQEAIGSNIRRETAKEASDVTDAVKTSAWMNSDRTGSEADRVANLTTQYFLNGQQNDFANATALAALKASTDAQFTATQAAVALAVEKNAAATALAAAATQMLIVQESVRGRELQEKNVIDELRANLSGCQSAWRHSENQRATQGSIFFGAAGANSGNATSSQNQA